MLLVLFVERYRLALQTIADRFSLNQFQNSIRRAIRFLPIVNTGDIR
jgi:hypothetical protein